MRGDDLNKGAESRNLRLKNAALSLAIGLPARDRTSRHAVGRVDLHMPAQAAHLEGAADNARSGDAVGRIRLDSNAAAE